MPQTKLQKRIKAYRKLASEIRALERDPRAQYNDGKLRPAEHLLRVRRFDLENLRKKIPQQYRWEFDLLGEFAP